MSRLGHAGTNSHLNRFGLHDTDLCDRCSKRDTIEHFLIHCTKYADERCIMTRNLLNVMSKVKLSVKLLLGGEDRTDIVNQKIIESVAEFLKKTDKLVKL